MSGVTFGRPNIIGAVPAGYKPQNMLEAAEEVHHSLACPVDIGCLNSLSRLLLIDDRAHKLLYAPEIQSKEGSKDVRRASSVLMLDNDLEEWRADLPPSLRFPRVFAKQPFLHEPRGHEKTFLQLW